MSIPNIIISTLEIIMSISDIMYQHIRDNYVYIQHNYQHIGHNYVYTQHNVSAHWT